jgi:hypothetical protein
MSVTRSQVFSGVGATTMPPQEKSRGIGDVIEWITKVTGIKSAVERRAKRTGKPCGCQKRKEALNKLVPFKKGKP